MIPLKNYLFRKFVSQCLIETGTSFGEGVKLALHSGYLRVFSIEKDPETFRRASEALGYPGEHDPVVLVPGDSPTELAAILAIHERPCTLWLDAHDVDRGECPILEELRVIAGAPCRNHTIMIDDWEDFGTPKHGNISKQQVIDKLRIVNPGYFIACYYAEPGAPNVLVATPT